MTPRWPFIFSNPPHVSTSPSLSQSLRSPHSWTSSLCPVELRSDIPSNQRPQPLPTGFAALLSLLATWISLRRLFPPTASHPDWGAWKVPSLSLPQHPLFPKNPSFESLLFLKNLSTHFTVTLFPTLLQTLISVISMFIWTIFPTPWTLRPWNSSPPSSWSEQFLNHKFPWSQRRSCHKK